MKSSRNNSTIEVQRGFGRSLKFPERFFNEVGDFVVKRFDTLPNGQAAPVDRSLLRPYARSDRSDFESYATVGMLPFAEVAAERAKLSLDVPQYGVCPLGAPIDSLSIRNAAIPRFIFNNGEGIIEYTGDVCAAEIIADVALAFQSHRVLVVSPHQNEVQRLICGVRRFAPFVSAIDASLTRLPEESDEDDEDDEAVAKSQLVFSTVSPAAELGGSAGMDVARFSIVIYTQAAHATDLMRRNLVCASESGFRLFGLLHSDSDITADANGHALQVFGIRRLHIPMSGYERSGVAVFRIQNNRSIWDLRPDETSSVTCMHRLQECRKRNSMIAGVARSFADGHFAKFGCGQLQSWVGASETSDVRTASIICRTYLQAARLASRLPGWKVYRPDTSPEFLSDLNAADHNLIERVTCTEAIGNQVLCPLDHLSHYLSVADPEFLIIGSGGLHAPEFPEPWFRHAAGKFRRRLIIDFIDMKNRVTRRHSISRFAEYEGQDIFDYNPAHAPEEKLQIADAIRCFQNGFRPCQNGVAKNER